MADRIHDETKYISVRGAREHSLKGVDPDTPRATLLFA